MGTTHFKNNVQIGGSLVINSLARSGKNLDIDYGTKTLTNDTETAVTTGLTEVLVVVVTESVEAGTTPASKILAYAGTGANKNKIYLKAKGATGTTTVNWIAIGIL